MRAHSNIVPGVADPASSGAGSRHGALIWGTMLAVFALDCLIPRGVTEWVLYFVPLALSLLLERYKLALPLTITSSFLIIVGMILSAPGSVPTQIELSNRILGILVLWLTKTLIGRIAKLSETLRSSEHRYRQLAESLPDAILVLDENSNYIYVNSTAGEHIGMKPKDIIGKSRRDFFSKQIVDEEQEILRRIYDRGVSEHVQRTLRFPTGEKWIETRFVPLFSSGGKVEKVMGISRDISQERRLEQALRQSEERYRKLTEALPDSIVILDRESRYLFTNRSAAHGVGLSPEEIEGRYRKDFFPPEILEADQEILNRVFDTGKFQMVERILPLKTGPAWIETRFVPLLDADGKVEAVMGVGRDVTNRHHLEESLRQNEEKYRSLAESSPDAIYILDQNSTYRYVNAATAQLLGQPVEALINSQRSSHFSPEVAADQQKQINHVFVTGEPLTMERERNFNGQKKWLETRIVPLRNARNQVEFIMGVTRDLTERRRTEEQLKNSLKEIIDLKAALDEHAIVAVTNVQGTITHANDKFCETSKYSREELVGRTHRLVKSDEHSPEFFKDLWATISRGKVWKGEIKNRAKDGSHYWVDATIVPMLAEGGKPREYVAIRTDITARKEADEKLRASELIFRQLAENIKEVFWVSSVDKSRLIYVSPAYERIWARTCRSLYDLPFQWVEAIHPEDRARVLRAATDKQVRGEYDEEYRIIRPDGSIRLIHDRAFPVLDTAGEVYHIVGIAEDITQKRQLQQQILQVSERERNRLARDLHDGLAQTLTSIGFRLNVFKKNLESAKDATELDIIAAKLAAAIGATRQLARGLATTELEKFGLVVALQNLAETTAMDYGLKCICDLDESITVSNAQTATHLYRIAQEAVHNVVKHANAGEIVISFRLKESDFVLSVVDNGIGFAPGQSFGMGLDIMHHRATMVGGAFNIQRRSTVGTIVSCSLPREVTV